MNKRFLWIGLLAMFSVFVIVAFANAIVLKPKGQVKSSMKSKPESELPVDSRLVAANNNFGIELFKSLYSEAPDKNIFISPSSIYLTISITYNGADGKTREEMAKVIGYQGMTLDQVNKANSALHASIEGQDKGVFIRVANSLWANKDINFKSEFMKLNKKFYSAQITNMDFNNPSAASTINSWVSDNTNGKISEIVNKIDPNTVLYVVNAIYFKGEWTDRFKLRNTRNGTFTLLNGETKILPMMRRIDFVKYYKTDKFQAISLPYGKKRTSMYLFLPNEESSLKELVESIDAENWNKWMDSFRDDELDLSLPKFSIKYEARDSMERVFRVMGMRSAFEPLEANFKNMCNEQVWINEVAHKTFIDVDENGSIAAGASSLWGALGIPRPLIFDRPFFLAIRDNKTGIVLFMGAVLDPSRE